MAHFGSKLAFTGVFLVAVLQSTWAADAPQFEVDPFWPKPLPNNWIIGQSGNMTGQFNNLHNLGIDSKGNIYTAEGQGKRVQKFVNMSGLD